MTSAIPLPVLELLLRGVAAVNRVRFGGDAFACPICRTGIASFLPLPDVFRVTFDVEGRRYGAHDFETLAVERYLCPVCRSADRDRLLALFLESDAARGADGGAMLHFAPERALSRFLRESRRWRYRTADLFMRGVDERIDLMDMRGQGDGSVDAFICSHVLEHVPDDRRAMAELHRILRRGGFGVVMSPIVVGLPRTSEDPGVTSPAERLRRFGQDDHVRVYAKADFVARLEEAGFRVEQLGATFFGEAALARAGIEARACLYVVRKPVGAAARRTP